jgi:hypothetical protein
MKIWPIFPKKLAKLIEFYTRKKIWKKIIFSCVDINEKNSPNKQFTFSLQ